MVLAYFTNSLAAIIFGLSFYPAGFFAVAYRKAYYKFGGTIKYLGLFMRKSNVVARLKSERQELTDELEMRKREYLKVSK